MSFDYPIFFYALPFTLLPALLQFRVGVAQGDHIVAAVRFLVMACILLGLTRPHTMEEKPAETLPVLLDISASIADSQGDKLLNRARAIADTLKVPLKVIPFARTVASQPASPSTTSFRNIRSEHEYLDVGGSHVENALRSLVSTGRLAASHPPALLLSDGYETDGSTAEALNLGISTRVFPLTETGMAENRDVEIAQLYAPLTTKAQRSVDIRTTLANHRTSSIPAHLTVLHGDKEVLAKDITLRPQSEETFTTPSDASLEGLNPITSTLTWSDTEGEHSISKTTWLSGEKREKILLLSASDEDARYLSEILHSQAYQLHSHITGRDSPLKPSNLTDFSAVILNNVARQQLPSDVLTAITAQVQRGTGVIMIGGPQSFGLGSYINSPLEAMLPVKLLPPRTEKKRLTVAIELVIDQSQSMDNAQKLEFAKIAANRVIETLKDDDLLGIIGFNDERFRVIRLAPVEQVRPIAIERISRLIPNGKTSLFPALSEAEMSLSRASAGRKHAIVITDGKLPDALINGESYAELVRRMNTVGITLSTVLVGAEDDTGLLKNLAIIGGGSHYRTMNAADIPSIFLSDVSVASGERSLRESGDIPVYRGPQGIHSTTLTAFPPLKGFVETLMRDDATTELIISDGEKTYPLLASRKQGDGKVLAFTSDANGRWSAPWMRWSSIHQFWSDIVDAARPPTSSRSKQHEFDLRHWIEGGELAMELALFNDPGAQPITAQITTPLGEKVTIPLAIQTIGRYRGTIPRPHAGTYRATFFVGNEPLPEVAWYISGDMFGEKQHTKPNLTTLQQIASRTGGRINPDIETLLAALTLKREKNDYSLLFFALALILFAVEVLLREGVKRR